MTQGDVIRKMDNEQLARLLADVYLDGAMDGHKVISAGYDANVHHWQEWVNYEMMVGEVAE